MYTRVEDAGYELFENANCSPRYRFQYIGAYKDEYLMDMPADLVRFECDPQEIDPRDAKTKSITPPVNGRDQLKYRYICL